MGPFRPFLNGLYILIEINYISKWVEVVATYTKLVIRFLKKNTFT